MSGRWHFTHFAESPGITELGYETRREAEAVAAQHGSRFSEH
jgi:hypothetical protein